MKRRGAGLSPPTRHVRKPANVKDIRAPLMALPFLIVDPLAMMQQWKRDSKLLYIIDINNCNV